MDGNGQDVCQYESQIVYLQFGRFKWNNVSAVSADDRWNNVSAVKADEKLSNESAVRTY